MEDMDPTSIVEPLQEMSISSAEPSNESPNPNPIEESSKDELSSNVESLTQNPSTSQELPTTPVEETIVEDFSFQVYPAIKMKQAIACLRDEHFNPEGLGVIEVGEIGLEITVRRSSSGAVGHLWLDATGLIEFKCSKEMIMKWVNLSRIYDNLADAADTDTITVHRLHGSNQVFFSFGNAPSTQFSEELLELDVEYKKFPKIVYGCDIVILNDFFKEIIQLCEDDPENKIVSVEASEIEVKMSVEDTKWSYPRKPGLMESGVRGLKGKQKHRAWFHLADCEFLKKATLLALGVLVCFTIDPAQQIMLRFNLRELGDLVYMNKSTLTIFNSHESDGISEGLRHLMTAAASLD